MIWLCVSDKCMRSPITTLYITSIPTHHYHCSGSALKLCALLSTNSYLNAPEFGSCSKEECTWIYGKYSKLEYSAEGGLVFLVEKLGTARQLAICPIWLLERETSLLRNSGCVSALLYWLIRRAETVSCSQTAFIWKAVVWKWSFRLHGTAHLVLGTLQLPAKKTILLFIQGKDGAAYMHKKEGNLHYHLVYITRPFWFPFWVLSKHTRVILLWWLVQSRCFVGTKSLKLQDLTCLLFSGTQWTATMKDATAHCSCPEYI